MTGRIDLNADAGESYGRWSLGDDVRLFRSISSVNVACGFHAGDPSTMRQTVAGAKQAGLAIGAHPGYPDKLGFGRRAMAVSHEETVDYLVYQVGALSAIAAGEGVVLSHVKPHGALMGAVCRDPTLALAIATRLQEMQPGIPLMFAPSPALDAVRAAGLPVIPENAVDLDFGDDGLNVVEPRPAAKDPDRVARCALEAAHGRATTVSGRVIAMPVRSICVHGDRPNAPEIAAAVVARLQAEGIEVRA
ncbi:5-oxoprolinase subunit PxpA [Amycolatopsis jejuensis]|uniref:5-oxoprolinase subunit PxpA n=1 Tax=Amycolatopsis jejuensis TaxID=330084 RepID=UPI0005264EAD|nr:5-oxoprolinase subunit PxpA [Amycolatopsis jejuensis]